MFSVRDTATTALRTLLSQQPTTAAKIAFAWRMAAGPGLGRSATTEWSEDGTLRVIARDEAWLRGIRHARHVIKERLVHLLGPDVVRRLVIVGPTGDNGKSRSHHA